jgi:hypothetical protein
LNAQNESPMVQECHTVKRDLAAGARSWCCKINSELASSLDDLGSATSIRRVGGSPGRTCSLSATLSNQRLGIWTKRAERLASGAPPRREACEAEPCRLVGVEPDVALQSLAEMWRVQTWKRSVYTPCLQSSAGHTPSCLDPDRRGSPLPPRKAPTTQTSSCPQAADL